MLPLVARFYFRAMAPPEVADKVVGDFLEPALQKHLTFLEGELKQSQYFAGDDFTAADIQITFVLEFVEVLQPLEERYPHLSEFLKKVQARSAYQKALERGGRYELSDFSKVLT